MLLLYRMTPQRRLQSIGHSDRVASRRRTCCVFAVWNFGICFHLFWAVDGYFLSSFFFLLLLLMAAR